jgi:hypothetical protein
LRFPGAFQFWGVAERRQTHIGGRSNTNQSSKEAEMFRDLNGYYSRPERPKEPRKLSSREEKAVIWILALNLVATIIAPIGGASVIEALIR